MSWYIAEPLELERTRADMSLGLRNSVWFYNNVSCPGVGSVTNPRFFTLGIIGVHISEMLEGSAMLIGNSIEALSMKYTFKSNPNNYKNRGVLAFKREQDNLTYNYLKDPSNYVTNTHRQNTSRYLSTEYGINVMYGNKYSNYRLNDSALEITHGLNQGSKRIDALVSWVGEKHSHLTQHKWLQLNNLQPIEIDIYKVLIESEVTANSFFSNYANIRKEFYSFRKYEKIESKLSSEIYKNIYKSSLQFLKIKDLLDLEINKAGMILSGANGSYEYNSLTAKNFKILKNEINMLNDYLSKSYLSDKQKQYIKDSSELFNIIMECKDKKKCLKILLERVPDYFKCEKKYSRGIFYSPDAFKELKIRTIHVPYSINSLISIKELLNGQK